MNWFQMPRLGIRVFRGKATPPTSVSRTNDLWIDENNNLVKIKIADGSWAISTLDMGGLTATVEQLNAMAVEGVSTNDIQKLVDITATAAEINRLVSGELVDDLHNHAALLTAEEYALVETLINESEPQTVSIHKHNLADGAADVTATAAEINQVCDNAGVNTTAANLNELTGAGFSALHKHKIPTGTPINAVAASSLLTISGVVCDGETVTINNPGEAGSDVYEFDANASVTEGNIAVDISGGTKTQATGTLTISGNVADGEIVTIGAEIYEIDTDGNITDGNIQVDLSGNATAATGTLTFTGAVSDGETVTIGNDTYEYDTNDSITGGNIRVDVAGDQTAPHAVTALVQAINLAGTEPVTAADGVGDSIDITASVPGAAANSITTTTNCGNASWGSGTLTGGADPTNVNASAGLATAFNINTSYAITATDNTGSVGFACNAAGAQDGSAGNSITTETDLLNGSFGASTLTGGSDCTAAEAQTALIAAVTASDTQAVGAADGGDNNILFTSDVRGAAGNNITCEETMANGNFPSGTLTGGVDGTVGEQWEYRVDADYLYVCVAANDNTGRNWRRITLGSAY